MSECANTSEARDNDNENDKSDKSESGSQASLGPHQLGAADVSMLRALIFGRRGSVAGLDVLGQGRKSWGWFGTKWRQDDESTNYPERREN